MPDPAAPADAAPPAPPATRTATRTAHRAAATRLLPVIAARTRAALNEAGIDIDIFLVVPNSGDAIVSFGTIAEPDPSDETWNTISQMVCQIVKDALSLKKIRTRELATATTRTPA